MIDEEEEKKFERESHIFQEYRKQHRLWTESEVNQIVTYYNGRWLISFLSFFALMFMFMWAWATSPYLTDFSLFLFIAWGMMVIYFIFDPNKWGKATGNYKKNQTGVE